MKIESQDRRVQELLKGNLFIIPRFQRPYSWEPDHVAEFWSDITENKSEQYFIGSMVVYKRGQSSLAVVDGQQRLTTITILLCALRDAFRKIGKDDLAAGLQRLIEQKNEDNRTVYVLKTETSYPYLQEEILKDGKSDLSHTVKSEEMAIQRAFEIFDQNISSEIEKILSNKEQTQESNINEATEWLKQIRSAVFNLNVILVTLDNEDDAYLIFETLNTRGKDLALVDLLRNHFMKFLRDKSEVDAPSVKWNGVREIIEGSDVQLNSDTFITHSWQSRYDFVTKAKTFQKVKSRINKNNALGHLDRFVSDAHCWRSLFDTDYLWKKSQKEAARSLLAMRTFKVVQPAPGLLSLVRAFRDDKIKYRMLREALALIERFHFQFNAVTSSRSSGGISGMYSSFGRQVFESDNSNDVAQSIKELKGKLRDREPIMSEFEAGFEQIIFTKSHSSQKALVQYILRKVMQHEGQPSLGETEDLTIEHLMPQSELANGADKTVVGQIGNLILVDSATNNTLANNSFKDKKKILQDKGYKLPRIFADEKKLDAELIEKNTQRISKIARSDIWKV